MMRVGKLTISLVKEENVTREGAALSIPKLFVGIKFRLS
jgi:hypothetical protein